MEYRNYYVEMSFRWVLPAVLLETSLLNFSPLSKMILLSLINVIGCSRIILPRNCPRDVKVQKDNSLIPRLILDTRYPDPESYLPGEIGRLPVGYSLRNLKARTILHGTSMTYGVVAIHYQGDDKFTLGGVGRVNLGSAVSYSPRLGRVVGLSANKECQVQSPKVGEEDGSPSTGSEGEGEDQAGYWQH